MPDLNSEDCLRIWEHAHAATPIGRALAILQVANPEYAYSNLVDMPIGQRDRALIDLRMATFGCQVDAYDECPKCEEAVELSFDLGEFVDAIESAPPVSERLAHTKWGEFSVSPLTSRDIISLGKSDTSHQLLSTNALKPESKDLITALEEAERAMVLECIEESIEQIDPFSNIGIQTRCPECNNAWDSPFDIGAFLWKEIANEAQSLLRDIHELASRYGWSEESILKLSKTRRQLYVNLTS